MTTYTENCSRNDVTSSVGVLDILTAKVCRYTRNQLLKARIKQERRQLSELSEAMLKDLGLSRSEAQQEALRTDIPSARLKQF